ncbi:hypothetical protein VBM87_02895, partial [Mycoplasma sp. 744]|uniref:hypothetical protein n=1 Tax=Mycoplasma sp. 744 TaxID=3108531 RepID=UPI002B1D391A
MKKNHLDISSFIKEKHTIAKNLIVVFLTFCCILLAICLISFALISKKINFENINWTGFNILII